MIPRRLTNASLAPLAKTDPPGIGWLEIEEEPITNLSHSDLRTPASRCGAN